MQALVYLLCLTCIRLLYVSLAKLIDIILVHVNIPQAQTYRNVFFLFIFRVCAKQICSDLKGKHIMVLRSNKFFLNVLKYGVCK